MKEEGLKDESELQSYMIARIEKYLNDKGREIIGWDEILDGGLAPNEPSCRGGVRRVALPPPAWGITPS
jgi:N-acetyl-beta-hexosaminidase